MAIPQNPKHNHMNDLQQEIEIEGARLGQLQQVLNEVSNSTTSTNWTTIITK